MGRFLFEGKRWSGVFVFKNRARRDCLLSMIFRSCRENKDSVLSISLFVIRLFFGLLVYC